MNDAKVYVSPSAPFAEDRKRAHVAAELSDLGFEIVSTFPKATIVCSSQGDNGATISKARKLAIPVVSEGYFKDLSDSLKGSTTKKKKKALNLENYTIETDGEVVSKSKGKKRKAEVTEESETSTRPKKKAKAAAQDIEGGYDGADDSAAIVAGKIFVDDVGPWSVMVTLKDPSKNQNKYYNLQLIVSKNLKVETCWVINKWGRIGYTGQYEEKKYANLGAAKDAFDKKFFEKTKNHFGAQPFKAYKGKYVIRHPAAKKKTSKKSDMPKMIKLAEHTHPLHLTRFPYRESDGTDYFFCDVLDCVEEIRLSNGPVYHCLKCMFDAHAACGAS
jgi:predicted DNA-binding WGR domain protein